LRSAGLLLTLFRSLAAVLATLTLLALLAFLSFLSLSTFLTLLPLLTALTLLLSLLLSLLIALLLLTVAVASRVLIQTTPQRIEVVSELPRAIQVFFGTRTVRATRALLRRLQTFGHTVQTALDRAFVRTARGLPILLSLLTGWPATLLVSLLITIQRLFALANALRDSLSRQRISRFLQLSRRALLALTLPRAQRPRRLFDILLQTVHAIGERVFSFGQLLASLARAFILRVLTAAPRETLHVFRDLALTRRSLRRALT